MPEYKDLAYSAQPRGDHRVPHKQFVLSPLEAMLFIEATSGTNPKLAFSLVRIAQRYTLTCFNEETLKAYQFIQEMHS